MRNYVRFGLGPAVVVGSLLIVVMAEAFCQQAACPNPANCEGMWMSLVSDKVYKGVTKGPTACGAWGAWGPWGEKSGFPYYISARHRRRQCSRVETTTEYHDCNYWYYDGQGCQEWFCTTTHEHGSVPKLVKWWEDDFEYDWFDPPDSLWEEHELYCSVEDSLPGPPSHGICPMFYKSALIIEGQWVDDFPEVLSHQFTLDGTPVPDEVPIDLTPLGPGPHTVGLSVVYVDSTEDTWDLNFDGTASIALEPLDSIPVYDDSTRSFSMGFQVENLTASSLIPGCSEGSSQIVSIDVESPETWSVVVFPTDNFVVDSLVPYEFALEFYAASEGGTLFVRAETADSQAVGPVAVVVEPFCPSSVPRGGESAASWAKPGIAAVYPSPSMLGGEVVFHLPHDARATVEIYDTAGRLVATLADRRFESGLHTLAWDGCTLSGEEAAAGVYFIRVTAGGFADSAKLMLVK